MIQRVILFALMNILILTMFSIISAVFGLNGQFGSSMSGMFMMCLIYGSLGSFVSLMLSKWMAKRAMGLQPIDERGPYGFVVRRVHEYARRAGLTVMPEVYVYPSAELNAFATGPSKSNSLVAVSEGLLNRFDEPEVEGVLAHEVAHIANGDMVTMALIQGIVNAFVMFLARIVAFAIDNFMRGDDDEGEGLGYFGYLLTTMVLQAVFGLLTLPIVAWFSRQREFRADEGGATLAGKQKMIAALEALRTRFDERVEGTVTPELRAMQISNKGISSIFSTHPPLEDRVAALRNRK